MPRILRTRQSREDYLSIEENVAQDSPQNAEMIIRLFEEKLIMLAAFNQMGLPRPELAPNLRSWGVSNFVLFYRPLPDGIILIRALRGSMDFTPGFFAGFDTDL